MIRKYQKQYNQLVEDLNEAITTFNTYITIRSAEVQAYNAAVNEYNAQAAELNQTINQISEQFGLSLAKDPIPLAETRDASVYQTIPLAETANTTPMQVHVYLPPPNSEVIGKNGPAPMAQLSYTATDASIYEDAIYNRIYAEIVTSLEEELNTQTHLLAMMSLQANQPHEEYSPDPFLNRKPLSQLLLPDANIIYRKKTGSEEIELILENLRIKIEAEKNLVKEATEGVITVSLKKFDEKRTDRLMDKLALLSVEQLSRRSLEALLNSIQQVGPSLALLPKDSPLFVIVFALNFVKNVLQETQTGQTDKEIDALMDKMFEVGTLGSDQKELIRAGIIIHQLMVAGKLLESNLGLSGLFTGFLASHLPHLRASPDQQAQTLLSDKLKTIFLDQGYSDDKAEFLAKMGSKGVFEGTFLAAPLSTITSSNIHLPVLIESLTAGLILSSKTGLSLPEATALAESAASRTLSQAPFKSSDRFRKVLENELKDLGLKEKSSRFPNNPSLSPSLRELPLMIIWLL